MQQLLNKSTLTVKRAFSCQMTRRTKDLVASIVSTLSDSTSSGVEKETLILQKRVALSRAITLIESQSPTHMQQADLLLNHVVKLRGEKSTHVSGNGDESDIMEQKGKAFRVGIAGAPGSGKSSLIESLGTHILDNCYQGDDGKCSFTPEKIAVVCIDPSSSITGGSILGDKTRMMELSRHPRAFVRPSPSKGVLGGLSSYTNDVVSLCEAAGYELVLVETVGLGQSEVDVSQAVDMLVLIVSPGGGDGLQGAKKGILEVADMLVVNKADGPLLSAARVTAADYKGATHFFKSRMEGWETPPVLLASAETKDGLEAVWKEICRYRKIAIHNNVLRQKRSEQAHFWMWKYVQELITNKMKSDEKMRTTAEELETALVQGSIAPRAAATKLLGLTTSVLAADSHTWFK